LGELRLVAGKVHAVRRSFRGVVRMVFVQLYEQGLIYRAQRMTKLVARCA